MALGRGLPSRCGNADGKIADDARAHRAGWVGGEGENVRRLVLAPKAAVQAAEAGVRGEQDGDLAAEFDGSLGLGEETGESSDRRGAQGTGFCRGRAGSRVRRNGLHRF